MKVRRSLASAAAAAGVVAAVVMTPGTASASSGGGCSTVQGSGGKVSACLSASGSDLEPDAYILSATTCTTTYIELFDDTTGSGPLAEENVGCGVGHYGPFAYKGVNGHQYYTVVVMVHGTTNVAQAGSPDETLSS